MSPKWQPFTYSTSTILPSTRHAKFVAFIFPTNSRTKISLCFASYFCMQSREKKIENERLCFSFSCRFWFLQLLWKICTALIEQWKRVKKIFDWRDQQFENFPMQFQCLAKPYGNRWRQKMTRGTADEKTFIYNIIYSLYMILRSISNVKWFNTRTMRAEIIFPCSISRCSHRHSPSNTDFRLIIKLKLMWSASIVWIWWQTILVQTENSNPKWVASVQENEKKRRYERVKSE